MVVMGVVLGGCASVPGNIDNACVIFEDRGWYESSKKSYEKWGVPIHVQLAIIHQESKFRHDAKPPRERLFWFLPGPRPTTAFGYAQVLDGTWEWYQEKTGNHGADRDNYDDAVDFIGWYCNQTHKMLGISKWDAKNQYLAYHEGQGGYRKKSYLKKSWLLGVADKVARNAKRYRAQLGKCRDELDSGGLRWFF
ncbi:MAG: transglycosylase SLT domain-containing protein [Magnetococcales bacterium]|nr:transglycosylase SLT domain-containing protein [Magnetococcales bacterium]